jgi:hypothetical protein
MIACDACVEVGQIERHTVSCRAHLKFQPILNESKTETEESLFVPTAEGILPVYVVAYCV